MSVDEFQCAQIEALQKKLKELELQISALKAENLSLKVQIKTTTV